MYTGHVAIALAARGVRDDLPLWTLVAVSQGCDWVDLFVSPFAPRAQPELYSHAFPFVVIGAAGAAAAVWLWKRSGHAAVIALVLYLSHPLADCFTGTKPLWLGGPPVGLGMIGRPRVDFLVQTIVCVVGFAIYYRSLPRSRRHRIMAASPLVLLVVLQGVSDLRLQWVKWRREYRQSIERDLTG